MTSNMASGYIGMLDVFFARKLFWNILSMCSDSFGNTCEACLLSACVTSKRKQHRNEVGKDEDIIKLNDKMRSNTYICFGFFKCLGITIHI